MLWEGVQGHLSAQAAQGHGDSKALLVVLATE